MQFGHCWFLLLPNQDGANRFPARLTRLLVRVTTPWTMVDLYDRIVPNQKKYHKVRFLLWWILLVQIYGAHRRIRTAISSIQRTGIASPARACTTVSPQVSETVRG
jgi:hypothetical protein